ncbi:MAG: hypothetical protein ABTD50_14495 [Polyangiaceae bacterium]
MGGTTSTHVPDPLEDAPLELLEEELPELLERPPLEAPEELALPLLPTLPLELEELPLALLPAVPLELEGPLLEFDGLPEELLEELAIEPLLDEVVDPELEEDPIPPPDAFPEDELVADGPADSSSGLLIEHPTANPETTKASPATRRTLITANS